jgi:threonine/homoserine/homoserine lactone efflux protein
MTLAGILVFALAYATAVASPGPGVAATVARALGQGSTGMAGWIAGFVLGDLIWFWVAALGLAALAQANPAALTVLRYAGAAYLVYIAYKIWTAPVVSISAQAAASRERVWQPFLGSLALTLGNAKVIVFFMAILPTIVAIETLSLTDIASISAVIALVMLVVMSAYTIAAARARRLLATPHALKIANRVTATALGGAAVAVARS